MANIPDTPAWSPVVDEIDVTEKVLGGPDGAVNIQAKQLADRTAYLKQEVESAGALAQQADEKSDQALGQIAGIEAATGSAVQAAASAEQHRLAAETAAALAGQSQQNAAADAAQAYSNATYAVQAAGTAQGKAAEASTSATVAQGAANLTVGARNEAVAARDAALAAKSDAEAVAAGVEDIRAGAAAARDEAVAAQVAIRNLYYGPLAEDPATRPDGTLPQDGDEYHNAVTGDRMVYRGGAWGSVLGKLSADLANATDPAKGAGMVGFRQAGAGAVPRTMLDKAREVVSVKDFGAVGDGVADDTAAIQAAINSGKGAVIFPAGRYRVTSNITVPANTTVIGSGRYDSAPSTARIEIFGCNGFVIQDNAANIMFHNICLSGSNTVSRGISASGTLYFSVIISAVNFFYFHDHPIFLNAVDNLRIDSCWFNQNRKQAYLGGSDGVCINTLFEGGASDLSTSPDCLLEQYVSDGTWPVKGMKYIDIQFERAKVGIRSNIPVDISGLNYSRVRCPIHVAQGFVIVDDVRAVAQGNEAIPLLLEDVRSFSFRRIALGGSGSGTIRNKRRKVLANLNANRTPSKWARVDNFGGTSPNFLTGTNASAFESDDYVWLQNGGTFLPEGSSSPKIDLGTLGAGSYVFELLNNGVGYFSVKTGSTYLIQEVASNGFSIDRKCVDIGASAAYTGYPGAAALGGNYSEFNVYKNFYSGASFDNDTNSVFTVVSGASGYSATVRRGGVGKSLSVTDANVYMNVPSGAGRVAAEYGVYVFIPAGSSLIVSTRSNFSNYDDKEIVTVPGDDKWHIYRMPLMPGTGSFQITPRFKASGVVYFDDAFCIELVPE